MITEKQLNSLTQAYKTPRFASDADCFVIRYEFVAEDGSLQQLRIETEDGNMKRY
jgi:hypothetical protein